MKAYIEQRIAYLRQIESNALKELSKYTIGTVERDLQWNFIRELGHRINELELIDTGSMPDTTSQVNFDYDRLPDQDAE